MLEAKGIESIRTSNMPGYWLEVDKNFTLNKSLGTFSTLLVFIGRVVVCDPMYNNIIII